ncbi:glycosyltransferase [Prosthecobacter sp.]|uniref:glycosyltransferase n=1 Tax=Prosthecobacter sp. TaxID=1965333 RepID=UPI0037836844
MSRKKVFLIAPPFSGHLHPLLGLAEKLQETADVTVLSTPGAARQCAVPFKPILAQHEHAVWAIAEPGQDVKSNPLLLYRQLKANIALLGDLKAELAALFGREKPDLVIADFTVPVAGIIATEMGIPWWTALASPCVFETPDGPPAYCGGLLPARNPVQRMQHALLRKTTRVFKRAMHRLFRQELCSIGLPSIYRADGSEAVYSPQRILALGVPEIEFPRTYPPHFQFIGAVLHTPKDDTPAPDFPQDERPCVLITLGTHLPHAKAALAASMRAIAQRHPSIVFHFTHGRVTDIPFANTENFQEHCFISYARHLPRYALVVHHAGAGILNHCLYHGIPSVVMPLDYDQFDNAARLVSHGLAVRAKKHVHLEDAILGALRDAELKARCVAMSAIHRRYDAAGAVAAMVQAL